jgi:hypothetical protein
MEWSAKTKLRVKVWLLLFLLDSDYNYIYIPRAPRSIGKQAGFSFSMNDNCILQRGTPVDAPNSPPLAACLTDSTTPPSRPRIKRGKRSLSTRPHNHHFLRDSPAFTHCVLPPHPHHEIFLARVHILCVPCSTCSWTLALTDGLHR